MGKNIVKTFVLMAALGGLLVLLGDALGGRGGMTIALVFAAVMNLGTYWFSDKIVLKMTRSRAVTEQEAPWLYRVVRELSGKAQIPMPRLYVMPGAQPNAFATGRNPQHAAVAVTEGILQVLSEEELSGVLAHEISHVANRDILIGAVAATVAAAITMLARMAMWGAMLGGGGRSSDEDNGPFGAIAGLLAMILAPIAAFMIQMAVSRSREAQADASGARLLGDATPLATALMKIDAVAKGTGPLDVNPAVSHLFLHAPFSGKGMARLFMSHPPLEERLHQLRDLGARV